MPDILARIDAAKQKLDTYPPLSGGEAERLNEDFCIEYTYNSNAIEGNTLNERETYMVLKDGVAISGKPLRHQTDIIGHARAFEYLQERVKSTAPISEEIILQMHRRALMSLPEDAGRYRGVNVYIAGSDAVLPAHENVPGMVVKLLDDYGAMKRHTHIVDCISLFHLKFEGIHPFVDGNGRTGRMLMNYELMLNGYPPIDIKVSDRQRYYYGFHAYQGGDEDETPMRDYVREYVLEALNKRLEVMESKK